MLSVDLSSENQLCSVCALAIDIDWHRLEAYITRFKLSTAMFAMGSTFCKILEVAAGLSLRYPRLLHEEAIVASDLDVTT